MIFVCQICRLVQSVEQLLMHFDLKMFFSSFSLDFSGALDYMFAKLWRICGGV